MPCQYFAAPVVTEYYPDTETTVQARARGRAQASTPPSARINTPKRETLELRARACREERQLHKITQAVILQTPEALTDPKIGPLLCLYKEVE
jgi:hypothetical protein